MGRYEEAFRQLERLVAERPDDPLVLNNVGYTYLSWPSRYGEHALALIQRAARMLPNDGTVLDSLGWAYYRTGRTRTALHWLLKAAHRERSAEIYMHVAEVYSFLAEFHGPLGDWDDLIKQQIFWTKRALLLNPNLPEARKQWEMLLDLRPEWCQ